MKNLFAAIVFLLSIASPLYAELKMEVDIDKPDGMYKVGDNAEFTVNLTDNGKPVAGKKIKYIMKFERKEIKSQIIDSAQCPFTVKGSSKKPGWLYLGLELLDENGKPRRDMAKHRTKPTIVNEIGVIFNADEIKAANSKPDDFAEYWAKCRKELDKIPINAKLTPLKVSGKYKNKIKCYAVEITCLGKKPVTGYLAYPAAAKPGSLPAQVDFLSLMWGDANRNAAIKAASKGVLAFFATWHGVPVGQDKSAYGNDPVSGRKAYKECSFANRDNWFFKDMYFRVMRALDYVKSRPEWDHKNLIVQGGSLGGIQTIAAAALDKSVTLAVVSNPAFCEFNAYDSGRSIGLPYRNTRARFKLIKSDQEARKTAAYFDGVNFAPMINCDIFVCTGLIDETCYPSSLFAFYNALPKTTKKVITINPRTGHYGTTKNSKGNKRVAELFEGITIY